jgi:hypothetical protein
VLFNLSLLGVGLTMLWALRGFPTWGEVLRLSGLAYLLGVAAIGVLLTLELVASVPLTLVAILLTESGLGLCALAVGRRMGRALPRGGGGTLPLTAAVFAALAVVDFEAIFRSARLAGVYEWDGWSFWLPKAKAIYYFGELDWRFLHDLPGPSYPPLVPLLESGAFHFMGSADVVTLHLQFWFLYLGFAAAVVGLLSTRVRPLLLWPSVLLMLATPTLRAGIQVQADFLLDEFFAAGALLVGLWLLERKRWQLQAGALLVGGGLLTKREGYLVAACILVAALVAARAERRFAWPRLVGAGAAALVLALPWQVWLRAHGIGGGGPSAGGLGLFDHLDRAWPSLRLAVGTFFDYDLYLATTALAALAVVLALAGGERLIAPYVGVLLVLALAGFTWSTWAFTELPITKNGALNPIIRLTNSLVIVAAVFTPMLLEAAWAAGSGRRREGEPAVRPGRRWVRQPALAWSLVFVAAVAYPVAALAGGAPRFPSVAECIVPATSGDEIEVVFGRFDTYAEAVRMQEEVRHDGFQGTQVRADGCGRIKVTLEGVPSLEVGRGVVEEAHSVGLAPTLERAG